MFPLRISLEVSFPLGNQENEATDNNVSSVLGSDICLNAARYICLFLPEGKCFLSEHCSWFPGGGLGRQGSAEHFGGFEFRKSVFFLILVKASGLSNKCCIFKCFMSSTVFLAQFYSPGTSANTALHYHLVVNLC